MKNWKPGLPAETLEDGSASMVLERLRRGESDFDGFLFFEQEFAEADLYGLSFTRCRFEHCRFAEGEQCSFVDAAFEVCDFSNANLRESWWQRCTFSDCRLVGAKLEQARLKQVRLKACAAGYANFDHAVFDRAELQNMDFSGASFHTCKLKELTVKECSWIGTDFYQTPLAGVDFTSSEIGGWTLSETASELRGAVVTPVQAVGLAERLGLIIR